MDKPIKKLSEINQFVITQNPTAYFSKRINGEIVMSSLFVDGYKKYYMIESDTFFISISAQLMGRLLESIFHLGIAEPLGETFSVITIDFTGRNGKKKSRYKIEKTTNEVMKINNET